MERKETDMKGKELKLNRIVKIINWILKERIGTNRQGKEKVEDVKHK